MLHVCSQVFSFDSNVLCIQVQVTQTLLDNIYALLSGNTDGSVFDGLVTLRLRNITILPHYLKAMYKY